MSKPRFIRSSQEDISGSNNIYGFKYDSCNPPINITKVYFISKGYYQHAFLKINPVGPDHYVLGYSIVFQFDTTEEHHHVIWTYVSEIMRDSDYGRILELFEVKL